MDASSLKNNSGINGNNNAIQIEDDQALRDIFSYYKPALVNGDANNDNFATEKDFIKVHNTSAQPWRLVPQQKIFYIKSLKQVNVVGNITAIILHLCEQGSNVEYVHWACSLLTKDLMGMSDLQRLYIKSTGLKKSISTGRSYYSYQLIQKNN